MSLPSHEFVTEDEVPRDHPAIEAVVDHYMEFGWVTVDMAADLAETGVSIVTLLNAIDFAEEDIGFELEDEDDFDILDLLTDDEDDDGGSWEH